jgi:Cu/Ag efflux pump CusA
LAYTLIGGTLGGTIMTLVFLPAMYSIWFKIRPDQSKATENAQYA